MKTLPLAKAFMLLEPGPVILVTTADRGKRNVMTISWHMVMDFTPRFALSSRIGGQVFICHLTGAGDTGDGLRVPDSRTLLIGSYPWLSLP